MPQETIRHVFVYGTLRRGQINDINRYRPAPQFVAVATVPGQIYHLGSYPGLVLADTIAAQAEGAGDEGGGRAMPAAAAMDIVGEIYAIAPALLPQLDALEGLVAPTTGEYQRRMVTLPVQGQPLTCLVYEVCPGFYEPARRIVSGDWTRLNAVR